MTVQFTGAQAGSAPLTWGQKAILQDMRDNDDQFTMFGTVPLPAGSTVADVAGLLRRLMRRHAALRTRLGTDRAGRPCQEVAGSGQIGLHILPVPGGAGPVDRARYVEHLLATWPLAPFDFRRDWPLRMAVVTQEGRSLHLVWGLSHLVADGTANLLLLTELMADMAAGAAAADAADAAASDRPPQLPDVARSEQEPQLKQLSRRSMRYWESQLRHIPALTLGEPAHREGRAGQRYWQLAFSSPAAHLAMLAIAGRTGTDVSRATLAVIATAIGRATGVHPLTVYVMVNNRFRPGLDVVIAPIAQNSVVTIDAAGASIDEVVAQTRGACLTAGMRAYYDPDDLTEVTARLDAERGYRARVSCRFNDQRAMLRRADGQAAPGDVTPERLRRMLAETSLAWYRPLRQLHDQVSIIIPNRPGVLSLYLKCDLWCLTGDQAEAILRGIEAVAVEAAFGPAAPAKVVPRYGGASKAVRDR